MSIQFRPIKEILKESDVSIGDVLLIKKTRKHQTGWTSEEAKLFFYNGIDTYVSDGYLNKLNIPDGTQIEGIRVHASYGKNRGSDEGDTFFFEGGERWTQLNPLWDRKKGLLIPFPQDSISDSMQFEYMLLTKAKDLPFYLQS